MPAKSKTGDGAQLSTLRGVRLFEDRLRELASATDRRFAQLAVVEWIAAIAAAMWISPRTWPTGGESIVHPNVWIALLLGGAITALPLLLVRTMPAQSMTRHVIAASQVMMAGLMVHMTGGRIETHFMYFGLLAFLSFYRDFSVLVTATVVTGADHLLRAAFWPQSMYGVHCVEWWRPLEHAGWVVFEVAFLYDFIRQNRKQMLATANSQARLESEGERIAAEVEARTADLARSEERYRLIFDDSPLPMWVCDEENMTLIAANQAMAAKYGYTHDELIGMSTMQLRPEEDVEVFKKYLEELEEGARPNRRWRHKKKDGTVFEVETAAHHLEREGRRIMLVLASDISERARAERERDALEVQLRHAQKLESIGQLAAGIAHEINTPTQYVGDNLHFLRDSFSQLSPLIELEERLAPRLQANSAFATEAEEIREALDEADAPYLMEEIPRALDQAIDGVTRIATLVKAMKEFSHPGVKEKAPTKLNDAIQSTITVARNEWKYVADMETDLAPSLPLVPCHASEFNQVILNLIVNAAHAIKDANKDGVKGTITIRTRLLESAAVEVRVEDTGTGIPVHVRERIFDPFFTTKEVGKGTGQGLAIARSVIIDKHGGTLRFETELGRGTAFVITMPLSDEPRPASGLEGESEEALIG